MKITGTPSLRLSAPKQGPTDALKPALGSRPLLDLTQDALVDTLLRNDDASSDMLNAFLTPDASGMHGRSAVYAAGSHPPLIRAIDVAAADAWALQSSFEGLTDVWEKPVGAIAREGAVSHACAVARAFAANHEQWWATEDEALAGMFDTCAAWLRGSVLPLKDWASAWLVALVEGSDDSPAALASLRARGTLPPSRVVAEQEAELEWAALCLAEWGWPNDKSDTAPTSQDAPDEAIAEQLAELKSQTRSRPAPVSERLRRAMLAAADAGTGSSDYNWDVIRYALGASDIPDTGNDPIPAKDMAVLVGGTRAREAASATLQELELHDAARDLAFISTRTPYAERKIGSPLLPHSSSRICPRPSSRRRPRRSILPCSGRRRCSGLNTTRTSRMKNASSLGRSPRFSPT